MVLIRFSLVLVAFLLPFLTSAQTKNSVPEPIASGLIIDRAIAKYSDDLDAEAIAHLDSVYAGDTNYVRSLYLKSLFNLDQKEYQKCIDLGLQVLELDPTYSSNDYTYNNIAKAYDRLGEHEKALEYFNKCLEIYPLSAMTYHNRGTCHARANNHKEAVADLQHALRINPMYARSHRTLGRWAAKEKKTSLAFISLFTSLLADPETGFTTLRYLDDTLLASDYGYNPKGNFVTPNGENQFDKLDKALQSKIAINNPKYKTGLKVSFKVVKQAHLFFDNFNDVYRTSDHGFWMEFYGPVFKQIVDNKQFKYAMLYSLISISGSASVKSEIEKNKKKIIAFRDWWLNEWPNSHNKITLPENGKDVEYDVARSSTYHYIIRIGKKTNDQFQGHAREFGSRGNFNAEGEMKNDEYDGRWKVLNIAGQTTIEVTYSEGEYDGPYISYYSNGNKKQEGVSTGGHKNGTVKEYYFTGELYSECNYTEGLRDGLYKEYYKMGSKRYEIDFKAGRLSGSLKEYYANGQVYRDQHYVDGKITGKSLYYYFHGQQKSETNYVDGTAEGPYKRYYPHGKLEEEGNYTKGTRSGTITYYFPDGVVNEVYVLDESGKYNGVNKEYTHDGKLNNEFEYRRGEIYAYRYYDKSGKVIKSGERKKGQFEFEGVYYDGIRSSEGLYETGEIGKVGEWKYYDKNGRLSAHEIYDEEGYRNGLRTEYFPNGDIESELVYRDDERNGYYSEHYLNGNLAEEGWYLRDVREGIWKVYYSNNVLKSQSFYVKGEINGSQVSYSPNGKIKDEYVYEMGQLTTAIYYDTLGNEASRVNFMGHQTANYVFNDGSKLSAELYSDVYHGKAVWTDAMGNKSVEGSYFNDERHGEWIWYYPSGKIETKGSYVNGDKHGEWIDYYENGKIKEKSEFIYGLEHNKRIYYYENGNMDSEIEYSYGVKTGVRNFYSPEGKLQLARHYVDDKMVGYQYMLPGGKLCDMIPLPNETGKCEAKFDNGKDARTFTIDRGLFEGEYITYYYNGNIYTKETYKNDVNDGKYTEYHPSGKIMMERNYKTGVKRGKQTEYYESGKVKSTCRYVENEKHGIQKTYSESGKLIKTETYYFGEKIAEKLM